MNCRSRSHTPSLAQVAQRSFDGFFATSSGQCRGATLQQLSAQDCFMNPGFFSHSPPFAHSWQDACDGDDELTAAAAKMQRIMLVRAVQQCRVVAHRPGTCQIATSPPTPNHRNRDLGACLGGIGPTKMAAALKPTRNSPPHPLRLEIFGRFLN